jgi:alpha-amylase
VKAVKAGKATVKAKVTFRKGSSKKLTTRTYTSTIVVKNPTLSVKVSRNTIKVGETAAITATVKPASAKLTYKSNNTAVATVSSKGVVKGVAAGGPVTITVTAKNGTKTVKKNIKITVEALKSAVTATAAGTTTKGSANVITVTYSAAVSDTAGTLANYKLNGVAVTTGAAIVLNEAKTSASITLPAGTFAAAGKAKLTIDGVKDSAGLPIDAVTLEVDVVDDTAAKLTAVHSVGTGFVLDLVFDEDIDAATVTAIDSAEKLLSNIGIIAGSTTLTANDIVTVKAEQPESGNAKLVRVTLTKPGTSSWNFGGTVSVSVKSTATIKGTDGIAIAPASAIGVTAAAAQTPAQ